MTIGYTYGYVPHAAALLLVVVVLAGSDNMYGVLTKYV